MADATASILFTDAAARAELSPANGDAAPGPYAGYRESGIPWLGKVPTHWTVRRLKTGLARNDGGVWGDDFDPDGTIVLRSTEQTVGGDWKIDDPAVRALSASDRAAALLAEGDLVITKSSGSELHIGKTSIVTAEVAALACCFSNFMQRLRCDHRSEPRFIYYILNSPIGREQMVYGSNTSTGLANLNGGVIGNILTAWPPLPEQQAIAGWLDERTRRVDELVAAKRRLIDLLAEQRTALISHAVTKGLNPAAPMKPSGIDWLRDIPRHWGVSRTKYVTSMIVDGVHNTPEYVDQGIPFVTVKNLTAGEGISFDDLKYITPEDHRDFTKRAKPERGDILITKDGTLGVCRVIETDTVFSIFVSVALVKPWRSIVDPWYLRLVFESQCVAEQFAMRTLGSGLKHLHLEEIGGVFIPLPPITEQRAIVADLSARLKTLSVLNTAAETAIARLTEYRQALISAAVTGKVCVCDAVAEATIEKPCAELPVEAPAVAARIGSTGMTRTANKHFQRSVLAAEIIARIGQDRTFGRVKLQKALILAEGHLQLAEIVSQPVRAAAGPFDNAMMRSIQSQLKKSQWYEYIKDGQPLKFVSLAKAGGHKAYFERYWGAKETGFAALMALLARLDTRRSEIVATLYSAWNDFLIDGNGVTDDALVAEVLTKWDSAKTAIPEAKWRAALPWMRGQGLVPTGYGAHTKARTAAEENS